ncbi:membrane protein [gut metagenome]|uniref:Membrane protein n=1 Tax=gut metagenome TaxID=749906 RepID=J9GYA3_9ZZZZ
MFNNSFVFIICLIMSNGVYFCFTWNANKKLVEIAFFLRFRALCLGFASSFTLTKRMVLKPHVAA